MRKTKQDLHVSWFGCKDCLYRPEATKTTETFEFFISLGNCPHCGVKMRVHFGQPPKERGPCEILARTNR